MCAVRTEPTPIPGTGTIVMRVQGNRAPQDTRIPNVRLVKMALHTLLSARQQLHQMKAQFQANGKTGSLMCDGREIFPMTVHHGLYFVRCELIPDSYAATTASTTSANQDEGVLLHAKLGHASASRRLHEGVFWSTDAGIPQAFGCVGVDSNCP
jgi:hypothetical protein